MTTCNRRTVRLRPLEDRLAPAGTTVITPGYTFPGTTQFGPDSWVRQMGNAIAARHAGPEGILRYDFAAGKLFFDGGGEVPASFAAGGDEYILYTNWESDSANGVPGWAEATAEGLAGALRRYGLAGSGRDLHLIGHSYGTVVNSETAQRLGYHEGAIVDQVTTLDPHDFYELFLFDPEANIKMPDVHVWANVARADNYFNTKGGTPLVCPHGRSITGAVNVDLTSLNGFGNGTGSAPHSRVHDYYALTIDPTLPIGDTKWYAGPPTDYGFRYTRIAADPNRDAYFAGETFRVDPAAPPVNPADVGADPPPRLFNGDFFITAASSGGRLAGYTDRPQLAGNTARLNATDNAFAHAHVLFPSYATAFSFTYNVVTPSPADTLTVSFNAEGTAYSYVDAALPAAAKAGQVVLDAATFPAFAQLLGKTVAVSFTLGGAPTPAADVRIDDLNLATRRPPVALAGGPYTVAENGTVTLAGAATDPDSPPGSLTYEWDFDGDWVFGETGAAAKFGDESGAAAKFTAAGLTAPATRTVRLRVTDPDGLAGLAAATVNVTKAPPRVASVVINGGAAQRSRVTSAKVTFDQPVSFTGTAAAAFQLKRDADAAAVTLAAAVDTTGPGTAVTLTFTAGPVEFGSLADGRFTLAVLSSGITGGLDGDGNGAAGDDFTFNLFRLFGDADGDADVDAQDFGAFRTAFGAATNLVFDFDNDGDVDAADFGQFRGRFGTGV